MVCVDKGRFTSWRVVFRHVEWFVQCYLSFCCCDTGVSYDSVSLVFCGCCLVLCFGVTFVIDALWVVRYCVLAGLWDGIRWFGIALSLLILFVCGRE